MPLKKEDADSHHRRVRRPGMRPIDNYEKKKVRGRRHFGERRSEAMDVKKELRLQTYTPEKRRYLANQCEKQMTFEADMMHRRKPSFNRSRSVGVGGPSQIDGILSYRFVNHKEPYVTPKISARSGSFDPAGWKEASPAAGNNYYGRRGKFEFKVSD